MDIVTDYNSLSERCDEIDVLKENKLVREIVHQLVTKVKNDNLPGLAANQLGYNKRVICMNFSGSVVALINPMSRDAKGLQLSQEQRAGTDKRWIVPRSTSLQVMYTNPLNKIENRKFVGKSAMMYQHLVNTLDGVLVDDLGLEIDDDWDTATDEEKSQIIESYLESLNLRKKDLQEEIESDEEAANLQKGLNIVSKIGSGELAVNPNEEKHE